MNKPVLIVIGIVVILGLVVAGVWYFMMPKPASTDTAEGQVSKEAAAVRDAVREESSVNLSLEANANAESGSTKGE